MVDCLRRGKRHTAGVKPRRKAPACISTRRLNNICALACWSLDSGLAAAAAHSGGAPTVAMTNERARTQRVALLTSTYQPALTAGNNSAVQKRSTPGTGAGANSAEFTALVQRGRVRDAHALHAVRSASLHAIAAHNSRVLLSSAMVWWDERNVYVYEHVLGHADTMTLERERGCVAPEQCRKRYAALRERRQHVQMYQHVFSSDECSIVSEAARKAAELRGGWHTERHSAHATTDMPVSQVHVLVSCAM